VDRSREFAQNAKAINGIKRRSRNKTNRLGGIIKKNDIIGFDFKEVPLEEAQAFSMAGSGNYSDVKAFLLERIPKLAPDKALSFGLPNGKEIEESVRRGICMAVNATLRNSGLDWRITYSSVKKLFICIPSFRKYRKLNSRGFVDKSGGIRPDDNEILKLRADRHPLKKIAEILNIPFAHVHYVLYRAKKLLPPPTMTPQKFVETAKLVFGYTGDFTGHKGKLLRKAISVVGINDLRLERKSLGLLLGLKRESVGYNANTESDFAKEEISKLRQALKEEA
jgi:hypothetical protein